MKLMIVGHARHGKDTVCEILRDEHNLRFTSSSLFCAERVMLPYFEKCAPGLYHNARECFDDRHSGSNRSTWFREISRYNAGLNGGPSDWARLGREMYSEYDIYNGIRNWREFSACKNENLFDFSVWVDRSVMCVPEDASSMNITRDMADFIIDNNDTKEDLKRNVRILMRTLRLKLAHQDSGRLSPTT